MVFLWFSYGFLKVFLGLKFQENKKKTKRKQKENKKKTKRKPKKTQENPRKPEEKKTRCRPSDNCAKMNKLEEFFYIVGSGKSSTTAARDATRETHSRSRQVYLL